MADILARLAPPAASPYATDADHSWLTPNVLVCLREGAGTTEHDVYDGPDGLCIVVGYVAGRVSAAEVHRRYRAAGLAAVAALNGQFIVLVHNRISNETAVVRDRVGFGHAYYWVRGDSFGISTNLPWLVRDDAEHGGPTPQPSARGVALYLTYQYVPSPDSVVHGVYQLSAGAALRVGPDSHVEVSRLVWFPTVRPDIEPRSIRAHGDRIIELITEAAADRLDGDAEVGVMMSGGMDTSTNAVVLVERLGLRPTAFTATFQDERYDESAFASHVATHLGVEHVTVPIQPEMITALPEVARAFETPNADQAAFAEHFLAVAAREHGCRFVVTGEGGDEVLGLPQSNTEDDDFTGLPDNPTNLAKLYLGRTELANTAQRKMLFPILGVPEEVATEPLVQIYHEYAPGAPVEIILYGQWRTWMVDGVYLKDSRVFRRSDVRAVVPMMSQALMEYVAALPTAVKLAGLADKLFLRSAVGTRLPAETLSREKHKFWLPVAHWFRNGARDFLRDHLDSSSFIVGILGKDPISRLLSAHDTGSDHSRLLWALLFLELWWAEIMTTSTRR
jgi:asparagine synthase (glutamine-hydrolysing)